MACGSCLTGKLAKLGVHQWTLSDSGRISHDLRYLRGKQATFKWIAWSFRRFDWKPHDLFTIKRSVGPKCPQTNTFKHLPSQGWIASEGFECWPTLTIGTSKGSNTAQQSNSHPTSILDRKSTHPPQSGPSQWDMINLQSLAWYVKNSGCPDWNNPPILVDLRGPSCPSYCNLRCCMVRDHPILLEKKEKPLFETTHPKNGWSPVAKNGPCYYKNLPSGYD